MLRGEKRLRSVSSVGGSGHAAEDRLLCAVTSRDVCGHWRLRGALLLPMSWRSHWSHGNLQQARPVPGQELLVHRDST